MISATLLLVRAEHDTLGDVRRELELLLERHRRDVLSVLELVELLHAPRDVQVAVRVEAAEIPRAEAAVGSEALFRHLVELVIAAHDARPVHDDLPLFAERAGGLFVDDDADTRDGLSDRAEPRLVLRL